VIGGYGVLLPILATLPWISNLVRRLGVVAPPLALAPAFAGTLALYVVYPWDYSGEIVELMLGLGFLCAALANTAQMDASGGLLSRRSAGAPALACTVAIVLGLTTAAGARIRRSGDDAYVRMARSELAALQHDFLSAAHPERSRYATRCDLHKRVYTYAEKYRARFLEQGDWMGLVDAGLPEQRAKYFLDPWNVPYWIRDNCARRTGTRVIFVYSFGPDRKRESTEQAIAGDDVGVYVLAPPG